MVVVVTTRKRTRAAANGTTIELVGWLGLIGTRRDYLMRFFVEWKGGRLERDFWPERDEGQSLKQSNEEWLYINTENTE